MKAERNWGVAGVILLGFAVCLWALPGDTKYSGGSGTAEDPYQIATAADLIAIGDDPNDCDKHFILTADLDLDPNLPGGRVFDMAVVGTKITTSSLAGGGTRGSPYAGGTIVTSTFNGTFDGNGHTIAHLTIVGGDCLGLFGQLLSKAEIRCLALVDVNVVGTGRYIGGLAGQNAGIVDQCYCTGVVNCADRLVGGLAGYNNGKVIYSYSLATVAGDETAGGLIGGNGGTVIQCYSTGSVRGFRSNAVTIGGFVGSSTSSSNSVVACLWDVQASGQTRGGQGLGKSTTEMLDVRTYQDAGWDFLGLEDGASEVWQMPEGGGYPVLAVFHGHIPRELRGHGTPDEPYLIADALDLGAVNRYSPTAHYRLVAPIDLSGICWGTAVVNRFGGVFDGNHLTISHLTISPPESAGKEDVGLFGQLTWGAEVRNLGVTDVNVTGAGQYTGGLAGQSDASILECYSTGSMQGKYGTGTAGRCVGGLVGNNTGELVRSYAVGRVSGGLVMGVLAGGNDGMITGVDAGTVKECYSAGTVTGIKNGTIGGLVGYNNGTLTLSYSTASVDGGTTAGGLVGSNNWKIARCVWNVTASGLSKSAGGVGLTADEMMDPNALGLNGFCDDPNWVLDAHHSCPTLAWEGTPGQTIPSPALAWLEGKGTAEAPYEINTTAQLIHIATTPFLWDKHLLLTADIDLDPNLPGGSTFSQAVIPEFDGVFDGGGHSISNVSIRGGSYLGLFGRLWWYRTEIRDLRVLNVALEGWGEYVGGLIGWNYGHISGCSSTGRVKGSYTVGGLVGLNEGSVAGGYSACTVSGEYYVGGLAGQNHNSVNQCHSEGDVSGGRMVGGLVGANHTYETMAQCYSEGNVSGLDTIGGLVGDNTNWIEQCYSKGDVSGQDSVGGLVGRNNDVVLHCYSEGNVNGRDYVAGLVGYDNYAVSHCYSIGRVTGRKVGGLTTSGSNAIAETTSFWDTQTSGQTSSGGGTGKTTAEMQKAKTFVDAGWDFAGETKNGKQDIWWIEEGKDYPRLAWETDE